MENVIAPCNCVPESSANRRTPMEYLVYLSIKIAHFEMRKRLNNGFVLTSVRQKVWSGTSGQIKTLFDVLFYGTLL